MANTYSQVHLHFVFAPKKRTALIDPSWEKDLYRYISGIIATNSHKPIIINGMPDHVHLLLGFRTTQSIADLMQDVKGGSSKWINDNRLTPGRFEWQSGYGVFSYSKDQLKNVISYIENQKQHHECIHFHDEYEKLLREFELDFNKEYLFKPPV